MTFREELDSICQNDLKAKDILDEMALCTYQSLNLEFVTRSFVIPVKGSAEERYLFVVYHKSPVEVNYVISKADFTSYDDERKRELDLIKAKEALETFPSYGFENSEHRI